MNRRIPMLVVALAGVLIASGCATFTDADAVARVGDTKLTRDDLADLIGDIDTGEESPTAGDGASIPGSTARQYVSVWVENAVLHEALVDEGGTVTDAERADVEAQYAGDPGFDQLTEPAQRMLVDRDAANAAWARLHFDRDEAQSAYQQGPEASGVACLGAIVTATEDDANDAVDEIAAGADFADVAGEYTVDPSVTALDCISTMELQGFDPEMREALLDTDVGDVTDPIEFPANEETLWVVFTHLPFDDVVDQLEQEFGRQESLSLLDAYMEDADVYVHPRYGTFSALEGVRPLAEVPADAGAPPLG